MGYFDGVAWIAHNHLPRCADWVDKRFADYYVLNYAAGGRVWWQAADGAAEALPVPLAWVCCPGRRFRYGSRHGETWDQRFVSFRGERVSAWVEGGLFPGPGESPFWAIRDGRRFAEGFEELFAALEGAWAGSAWAVHRLEGLLLSRLDPPASGAGSWFEGPLSALAGRVAEDPAGDWDFRKEGRGLGMSYTHFRQSFKAVVGLAPHQFLIAQRLEHAAGLLRRGSEPIKTVAARSGYPDLYYFSRLFRRRYGLPPARYRRRAQSP